jgi:hypothetical protein
LAYVAADVGQLRHAQVLLKADAAPEWGPAWTDARIAEAIGVGVATVERLRQRFVEAELAAALSPYRGGKRGYEHNLDGEKETHLIALACSTPPEGRGCWSVRLLARRMVDLGHCDVLSHETVRRTHKKTPPSRDQLALHHQPGPQQAAQPLPIISGVTMH